MRVTPAALGLTLVAAGLVGGCGGSSSGGSAVSCPGSAAVARTRAALAQATIGWRADPPSEQASEHWVDAANGYINAVTSLGSEPCRDKHQKTYDAEKSAAGDVIGCVLLKRLVCPSLAALPADLSPGQSTFAIAFSRRG